MGLDYGLGWMLDVAAHPDYEANGSCKMCTCKIDGRQVSSCTTPASDGQVVESNTEELNSERRVLAQMSADGSEPSYSARLQPSMQGAGQTRPQVAASGEL